MGFMTAEQVSDVNSHILVASAAGGQPGGFGQVAVQLAYLKPEDLQALEAEERRRRRLITGYEIINIIGTGTIATVYHARQLSVDREVALKILHPRLASDPIFVRAYIAEAQAVSRFHHPNIVQGFDAGESNGFYYFAHEYLSGGSLADRLRLAAGEAVFSETRLLSYLRQTTAALRHAWNVAVYHGDINPGNLLLDGSGNIKLANLGVPRVAGLRATGPNGGLPGFIRCGPDYAAPEQLERPELVDARTDMYNLGATFYHISFGIPPFASTDGLSIAEWRKRNPMPSFSLKSQEGFSGKYLRLLHDMLEADPDRRPSDPEALAARLEKFHVADGDDSGGLARQVRHIPAASSSGRLSARVGRTGGAAPSAMIGERRFSLKRRVGSVETGRGVLWMKIAMAVLAAAVIAGILFH